MKKIAFSFLMLVVFGLSAAFAQTSRDTITIKKSLVGHSFWLDEVYLSSNQLNDILSYDDEARKPYRLSKVDEGFCQFFSYVGGFCVGIGLASAIFDHNSNVKKTGLILMGSGVASVAVGFGFASLADKRMVKAVSLYNKHLGSKKDADATLSFGFVPNGLGVTLSF